VFPAVLDIKAIVSPLSGLEARGSLSQQAHSSIGTQAQEIA
jgi:hypothetical protein